MIKVYRPLLALFCGVAFMIGASPARATVFTANASISSPPVTVTSNNPLLVSFDFGQSFASITFVQFQLSFSGDLWDHNEQWFLDDVGGQTNLGNISQSGAALNVSPSDTAFYDGLLDGKFSTHATTLNWFTTTSYGLASIALEIDATPLTSVPEPAALGLLVAGLVSLASLRRRRA